MVCFFGFRFFSLFRCARSARSSLCCFAVAACWCEVGRKTRRVMASHAGVRIDEDVYEGIMEDSGCKESYFELEDCLAESGRDWTKCQSLVKAWRQCMSAAKKNTKAHPAAPSDGK